MSYINKNKIGKDEELNKKSVLFSRSNQEDKVKKQELKKLKDIKKKIKKIKTVEELEEFTAYLEAEGLVEADYLKKLKKKKRKKLEENTSFFQRIRADQDTINRMETIMKNFRMEVKEREINKEQIQNRDDREPVPGSSLGTKDKERKRESGGRSLGGR